MSKEYVSRDDVLAVVVKAKEKYVAGEGLYNCMRLDMMELPTKVERDLISEDDITVYGYTIRELTAVAEACRLTGTRPEEIRGFLGNLEFANECIAKEQERIFEESMRRISNNWTGVTGTTAEAEDDG